MDGPAPLDPPEQPRRRIQWNTHGVSGEADAVVLVARTADRLAAAGGGGEQIVGARSTDAVSARRLARLAQRRRAADAAVARVDAGDELDRRRLDEGVEVGVDRQARQLHVAANTSRTNSTFLRSVHDPTANLQREHWHI